MKNKYLIFLCFFFLIVFSSLAQTNATIPPPECYANGNSGFGGVIGLNKFINASSNSDEYSMRFIVFNGGDFDDVLVFYIDTGSPGRNVIDSTIDDATDGYTIAITNSNANGFGSTITFPPGFEATHALAIDASFGGIWSIPSSGNVGTGDLTFISSLNSTLTSSTQTTPFDIFINYADLGLPPNGYFDFVALYVSHLGETSDEGYGDGIIPGTYGTDDVTFIDYLSNNDSCSSTLDIEEFQNNLFNAFYHDGKLNIIGLNDKVSITVYDLTGRIIQTNDRNIYGSAVIQLELTTNQIQFIKIEGTSSSRILKIIPN